MRSSRPLRILLAALVAVFACAQLFGATTSSFTDSTASAGNTVTAAADWSAPVISSVVLQKSKGGVVNKFNASETFYIYASVADSGNPAAGVGTITASTSSLTTASSATLSAGSWTVNGTTYNYRTNQLTAKSSLSSTTYSYSLSVSDAASNGPATQSASVVSSNASFAPSSVLTTNVATAGRPLATDKIAFTYNSAPDPESVFAGWDGTSRSVSVIFADRSVYSMASDLVGVVDGSGNTTSLGYALMGGDYINSGKTVTYANSTLVLSGSTYTVTLGTPNNSEMRTDSFSRTATWTSTSSAFDTFGNASSAANVSGSSRVQF
jgi:hypothetical protein